MMIDIVNILNNYKHIHNFVIVTGDVDFKELFAKISSEGKNVIGISCYEKSTSKTLKNFCNEFIVLDKTKKSAKPNKELKILRANIAKVCISILEDEPNINIGLLKSKLLNIDPSFNELNFGYNSFSEFIKTFEDDIKLEKDNYGNYWASLK
jgi:predicted nuclease of predicted toxin-antitoxin system